MKLILLVLLTTSLSLSAPLSAEDTTTEIKPEQLIKCSTYRDKDGKLISKTDCDGRVTGPNGLYLFNIDDKGRIYDRGQYKGKVTVKKDSN